MSAEIYREWKLHQSTFSRKWRIQMLGKKKIIFKKNVDVASLNSALESFDIDEKAKKIARKDLHLVAAAQESDGIVISLDDESHRIFRGMSKYEKSLCKILWLNPNKNHDEVIDWLHKGAPHDAAYTLRTSMPGDLVMLSNQKFPYSNK